MPGEAFAREEKKYKKYDKKRSNEKMSTYAIIDILVVVMHIRAVGNKHTMAHHHINQAGNEREREKCQRCDDPWGSRSFLSGLN